ncbi:MAG TPA: glycosyltransferase, partial [Patescibacteria group bacterium]|nr:glycosyltransferase [Patescibacteria group bacterium]
MKILFTGGGTIGSVSPLLAVKSEMEKQGIELRSAWVGSRTGVEVEVMAKEEILYYPVSSGKFRRYFSWRNFLDLFKVLAGFFQSISIIRKFKPDLVIT